MRRIPVFFYLLGWCGLVAAQSDLISDRLTQAEATTGQLIFNQCAVCHTASPDQTHRIGPSLWDIVGRPIAHAEGFDYSPALAALTGNWDFDTLDVFLTDPMAYAPGTRMVFPGIKDGWQRAHLMAYLRTLSASPVPLPATSGTEVTVTPADDPFGADWPIGPGRELTGYVCNACHSLALVKQQGLPRTRWDKLLDWMVEEQGMDEPGPEQRELMLDYLSTHFGVP